MFALVSFPDGTPIVIAGPCWPFCIFVTLPLILGISVAVSYFMIIDKNSVFNLVRYDICEFGVHMLCHQRDSRKSCHHARQKSSRTSSRLRAGVFYSVLRSVRPHALVQFE